MSDLIFTWLNDEVNLSQKIVNFEQDFSNGYFFGELLSKYNQQLNFSSFKNKETRDVKIRNFNLLKPTFATLRVKFDSRIADDIMTQKKDTAPHLLYQLKMALEKVNNPADVLMSTKTGKFNTITPLMMINPQIKQYAAMDQKFFDERLCAQNRPQKAVNLDKELAKFETFKTQQNAIIAMHKQMQDEHEKAVKDQMRKIELNKLQRNMAFQEDWNEKGHQQWTKNQEISKQRVDADRKFAAKETNRVEGKRLRIKELVKNETNSDIVAFEENLKKKGLGIPDEVDEFGDPIKKEQKNSVSAGATMTRIKENSQVNEFLRKERDKRRRKMIVDQAKLQRDVEVRKREELVLKKLEQQSKQEKEIEYEIWRAYQCKDILVENRALREDKYRRKNEVTVINAKYKEEELLKIVRNENDRDIQSKLARQREIEISEKQTHRREVFNSCRSVVDKLVDLANICYSQLQQEDSETMDVHFIENQIKLFIENQPLLLENHFPESEVTDNLVQQEQRQPEVKNFLASKELEDFLSSKGDWVPQHNFTYSAEELAAVATQNSNNRTPLASSEDKIIPNKGENNFLLGDLVVSLLKQYYKKEEEELTAKLNEPNHFDWLPVKASILGYQFSGKKTLANCIAAKYGVKMISIDSLITDLLSKWKEFNKSQLETGRKSVNGMNASQGILKSHPQTPAAAAADGSRTRIPPNSQQSMRKREESTSQLGEKDLTPVPQLDESGQKLAAKLESYLYSGKDLPNEIYIELIMRELNQIHPKLSEQEYLEKVSESPMHSLGLDTGNQLGLAAVNSKVQAITADLRLTPMREDQFKTQLQNNQFKSTTGVVLLDFPQTYEQASLLETAITGFLTKDQREKTELENSLHSAEIIVKPTPIPVVPREKLKPGIDLVFHVDITKNESLRRALGRRFDSMTKQHFHLEDNPPPIDNAPLIERLDQIREYGTSELAIVEKNCGMDLHIAEIREWFGMFGQSVLTPSEIVNESTGEQEFIQKIVNVWQEIEGTPKIDEIFYQIDAIIQDVLRGKEQQRQEIRNKLDAITEQARVDEEIARIAQENEAKWLFTPKEEFQKDIESMQSSIKIDQTALANLYSLWKSTQAQYVQGTQSVFFNLNEQKQAVQLFFHKLQKTFLELIQKPDNKFILMRKYQEEYNKFVEQNPDMCEEDQTKEELHQRVEDLHDTLFDIIEAKRDQQAEERNQIIKSGWIEREMEKFTLLIQKLLQSELTRSFGCQSLISDYCGLSAGLELQEIPEFFKSEITLPADALPPIEDVSVAPAGATSYPRLEKLVELTLKLHAGEEIVEEKPGAKKGGKAPPPAKKDDKKAAKKGGKGAEVEVEEVKVVTPQEQMSREAIAQEKQIFRYRVQVIKDYALSRLKLMRAQANLLYGKFQDWIDYTFKAENDAVDEMDKIFRDYIEHEQKIQHEIQLNYVDVVVSHQTLNFLTPPPIILPAKEVLHSDRFSVSQLYVVIEEIRSITNESNRIEARTLLQLLMRKTSNKLSSSDLPQTWRGNTLQTYQRVISNLDPEESGYIDSKDFCTYLCLVGSRVPAPFEKDEYYQQLQLHSEGDEYLSRDVLTQAPAWFDSQESQPTEINTNAFERSRYLKELLFQIHKDPETESVELHNYLHSLSAVAYQASRPNANIQTFADLLFI